MKPRQLLVALLASYPAFTICTNTAAEIQGQEPATITRTAEAEADSQITTTLLVRHPEEEEEAQIPTAAPVAKRFQARQYAVAARTTSEVITSIVTLPTPTPIPTSTSAKGNDNETSTGGDGDETSDSETPSSTVTITITSNRTTTIRPTVTVTSLFSSVGSSTSGSSGRLEPHMFANGFMSTLLLIFSLGAVQI
ncbi:hypothetical protein F4803DRAFT_209762 [Xylaria telfairii]|nr:hypothetical protein F4803DRAFT_209762 [Xylaria telfairii]